MWIILLWLFFIWLFLIWLFIEHIVKSEDKTFFIPTWSCLTITIFFKFLDYSIYGSLTFFQNRANALYRKIPIIGQSHNNG